MCLFAACAMTPQLAPSAIREDCDLCLFWLCSSVNHHSAIKLPLPLDVFQTAARETWTPTPQRISKLYNEETHLSGASGKCLTSLFSRKYISPKISLIPSRKPRHFKLKIIFRYAFPFSTYDQHSKHLFDLVTCIMWPSRFSKMKITHAGCLIVCRWMWINVK